MSDFDVVLKLFLQLVVILLACRVVSYIGARFLKQTTVVSEMIAGVLLGPSLLGLFFPHIQQWLFPITPLTLQGGEHISNQSMTILFRHIITPALFANTPPLAAGTDRRWGFQSGAKSSPLVAVRAGFPRRRNIIRIKIPRPLGRGFLFTALVVMAIVTTVMTSPIYYLREWQERKNRLLAKCAPSS
jgi:hypothetical protein